MAQGLVILLKTNESGKVAVTDIAAAAEVVLLVPADIHEVMFHSMRVAWGAKFNVFNRMCQ